MRLEAIRAVSHSDGRRIDLAWVNPRPRDFPGMRVVRRESRHPVAPDDGAIVLDGIGLEVGLDEQGRALYRAADTGLPGGRVYYYSIFPYQGSPPLFDIDRANRAAALATPVEGVPARMYGLLPAIYRRFDAESQQLLRLLEVVGQQLDLMHGYARFGLDFYDLERTHGALLPLLAHTIGWRTDYRLELDRQRSEVRNAPALYKRIGVLPAVAATVRRVSGWRSRSKEFVHNVARSNRPPRLNLWARRTAAGGGGVAPDALLSLDDAYEGRASAATDRNGVRWLFYHTRRLGRWQVWFKTSPTFPLPAETATVLDGDDVAALQAVFAAADIQLAATATIAAADGGWQVDDGVNGETYRVEREADTLLAYHTSADALQMAPSRPLDPDSVTDERHPVVGRQGDTLWVVWDAYDAATGRWSLRHRLRRAGAWSETRERLWEPAGALLPERRSPAVAVDDAGGLWLFWLERSGGRWAVRYNRHDGSGLAADPADGWELDPAAEFPLDGTDEPRAEADLYALFHAGDAARPLWLFWARKEPAATAGQTRWAVVCRSKSSLDPTVSDWSGVRTRPKADADVHDREPAAHVDEGGDLIVHWASDRDGSWSIWRAGLDATVAPPGGWTGTAAVTAPPYAQRNPLPLALEGGDTVLVYRSSESVAYASTLYAGTQTLDARYAGSLTAHARHSPVVALRGEFEDFQRYSYDAGTENEDWYRRDTLGVYLAPGTLDPAQIRRGVVRLGAVIPEFMPATDRAVFIVRPDTHVDYVYDYERSGAAMPNYIADSYADALSASIVEPPLAPDTDFSDDLE